MAISLTRNDNEIVYGVKEYVIDTRDDINSLPASRSAKPGSTAFCVEDTSVWMLNTKGEWIELLFDNGSTSGGGSSSSGGGNTPGGGDNNPDGADYADENDIDDLFS